MKITTKTGDKGETGLFRSGRVSKSAAVIEVLGEIDELQSFLGWCKAGVVGEGLEEISEAILHVQDDLYRMMSIFGGATGEILEGDVEFLEGEMERWKEAVEGIKAFVKPGADEASSRFHIARSVCRRVERKVVRYFEGEEAMEGGGGGLAGVASRDGILKYLNRLSDLLFVWAVKF
ncbi:MAG: cob(I)yrinic acid a,c-diamide adenosyltransferase [Candidatus Curtissbacteria bacterium]|nr:cob(I)yrinic acid a,c-diamide adenosyltransferase [Candidatus Curtissbacteria bacterium]